MYKIIFTFFITIFLIRGEDYYEILGISKSAGQDEIRKAFKKLVIIHHPDKNSDDPNAHDKFIRLTTAYEVLKEPDSRRKYDLYGKDGLDMSNKKQTYHSWSYYQNNFDIYGDDQHVVTLEKYDYFESVTNSDSTWFVNFYSPMCSHCHHLAPVWKEVAKLLDGVVKIAVVNCEDNWQLCHQVGIRAYPTLLHFKKSSQHGTHYMGRHTQEAIMRFALDKLNIHIPEINKSQWKLFLRGMEITERPVLVFTCGSQQNCFTSEEKLIVAAVFDKVIDAKILICENDNCHRKISYNTHAVYLPMYNASSWEPVFFDNMPDTNSLIEKLLDQLPGPQELSENDFENIKKTEFDIAWLVCFYLGDSAAVDMQIKKLSTININFGKMNCGRNGQLCNKLGVNRYPVWGVLKPGGAFELHHGKNTNNDIIKFVQISAKATNIWALTAEETLSILLQRNSGNEVWFLDWYAPWCPPCVHFLSELRRASLEFDVSIVRFGTIDCTVHATLCRQYNIHSYPTAILINGSSTYQFTTQKTAANVIQFINEKRNPSVIELTSENFNRKLAKKKSKVVWIVDYFAPWCGPCQRLAPEWVKVARSLSDLSFVNVASVNCEIEASLCASQGVRSYPNIRLYPIGSEGLSTVALYNGQRDSLSILTWITTFFPKKVRDLNPSEYREVLHSKHTWIIEFYVPRCGHCQRMEPQFAIAAQLMEKVRFGRINCNFYMHDCVEVNIQVFPTLILYKPKQRSNSHDGFRVSGTTAKTIRDEILEIIKSRMKHDEL